MLSLGKRYLGHEKEILRDVRLEGRAGAMIKWGASFIAWEKYILSLKVKEDNSARSGSVGLPGEKEVNQDKASNLQISRLMFSRSKSLAEELVDAFENKVVILAANNKALEEHIKLLEEQLKHYRHTRDAELADKMIRVIGAIN